MLPGLHPGLLVASRKKLGFIGTPTELYISTSGGPGNRQLGLALEIVNGTGPYTYEWEVSLSEYGASPASGAGTVAQAYVAFTTNVYVEGGLSDYREVGRAHLRIWDAGGVYAAVEVPVFAGQ